jgi:ribosomal protein S18 acetylase RimI-like enzyme
VEIREATSADAAALLELKRVLDRESTLMLLEPDERGDVVEIPARTNAVVLVADVGDELAGYAEATGGSYRRERGTAYVVLGVRAAHAGRGVGTALLRALEAWAPGAGIRRLELTVQAHNAAAIALYRKLGYVEEGVRRASLEIDGAVVDELWMARVLSPESAG